ncbi:hypothetical protein CGZ95_04510 [Enemella evansiae]|nr:hypothetical protein CGZ95_04510 [Enemella evansiae]
MGKTCEQYLTISEDRGQMTSATRTAHQPRLLRRAMVVGAVLFTLIGLPFTVVGAIQGNDYFAVPDASLSTDSAAMVTREIDVEGRRPTDPQNDPGDLSRVRIQVRPADPNRPVFVGIGRRADVERYLRGVAYDEMATFTTDPLRVTWQRHPGGAAASPPAAQSFWAATSKVVAPGVVELEWDKSLGEWMAVAMNADGSPGLVVSANIGLRWGFLLPVGIGCLVLATTLVGGLILLTRRAVKR